MPKCNSGGEREREAAAGIPSLFSSICIYIRVCGFGLTSAAGPEINERKREEKGDMTDENETWDRKNVTCDVLGDATSSSGTKQGE